MDFFHSLSLDLKILVVAIVGSALLALFSGNQKSEKRYMLVFAVLAAVGVYRFTHSPVDEASQKSAATPVAPQAPTPAPKRTPLVSTSGK